MGVTRTAISLANTPETTAQALLAVALNPDRTKAALVELSASKADHDASRKLADTAKYELADLQETLDVRASVLMAQEKDLASREAALAANINAFSATVAAAQRDQDQRERALNQLQGDLQTRAADLVSRETALVPREAVLDAREADLKQQKKDAADWLAENKGALEQARKLLSV